MGRFAGLDAQVLGISVDSVPCLTAWADSLGGITYPLLSDFWPHGSMATKFGVLRDDGTAERAIFIIDSEGMIRYVDVHDKDEQPSNEVLFAELHKVNPDAPGGVVEMPRVEEKELPHGGVVMYCRDWCPDCKHAKRWLDEHQTAYQEVNIDRNPLGKQQLKEWTGGNLITPTFDIDGEIIIDFDKPKLEKVLGVLE